MKKIPKRRRSRKQVTSATHKRGPQRPKWILGSIGLVMVVSVAVVFWRHEVESPSPPNISPPPSSIADTEGVQADEIEAVLSQKAETVAQIQAEELRLTQHLVEAFPNNEKALVLLGSVYRQHGDSAKNMELWHQALTINPQQPELYQRLGEAAYERGELERALAYWQQGLDVEPQSPNLRWLIAKTYVEQGQHEQAIDLLIQECALTPRATRNFYLLGQVHLQLKAYEQAKTNYAKAIELSPSHYNAYFGLANACMRLKERAKATEYMKTFQELKRQFDASEDQRIKADEIPQTRRRMARFYFKAYGIYQQAGQAKKAENLLLRARQLDPNDTAYLENLAAHYYRDNRLPAALETYEEACAIDPNRPLFFVNIGKLFSELGQPARAKQAFEATLRRFPDYGLGYAEFARFCIRTQADPARTVELARRAVDLDPIASNFVLLSWAHDIMGDNPASLAAVERAVELAPDNQGYRIIYERIKEKQ